MPEHHTGAGPVPAVELIERAADLAEIAGVVEAAAGGRGRAVLLEGPAGIGKTALLDTAVQLGASRALILRARAAAAESAYAHGVVRQLLARSAAARLPLRGAASVAGPVLGLEPPTVSVDAAAGEHALYWLCAELAEERPVVLVVDDAQWADRPSLSWLTYLARRIDDLALSIIVSWRAGTPSGPVDLLDALRADPSVQTLAIQPLTEDGVRQLVERAGHARPSELFVQRCAGFTGGNPLYVVEVMRALGASGLEPTDAASTILESSAPELVSMEISRRLAAVDGPARALAEAIAVLDVDAEIRHAAELAELEIETALTAADELADALLLDVGVHPRLSHPIIRRVVYELIPPGRRLLLHRRAADILDDERAVGHLLRCAPAGDQTVVRTLLDVARRDLARGAVSNARTLLDRALREPATEQRADVMLALGRAGRLIGDRSAAEELREAQRLTTAAEIQEEALLEQALLVGLDDRPADALTYLDRAMALHPAEDEAAIRRLLAMRSAYALTHDDLARRAGNLAARLVGLPAAGALGDGEAGLLAVAAAQATLDTSASAGQAARWARRAVQSGGLAGSGSHDLLYGWAVRALMWTDQGTHARALVRRNVELAVTRGWRDGQAAAHAWSAYLDFWDGNVLRARTDAHAALELGAAGAFGADFVVAVAALLQLELSGPEDALNLLARRPSPAATSTGLLLRWARCQVHLESGSAAEAAVEADAIVEAARRRGAIALGPRATAARALARAGRGDEAQALITAEIRDARRWGADSHLGIALRELALLGPAKDARPLLEQSVDHLSRSPRQLERARSQLALGSDHRRAGDRVVAREHLREALDTALSLGARPLADRAVEELRASGARIQRRRLSGVESLTPSEHRVANLAAQGLSNSAIAQRLYVSRVTVETHLTRVYRKLEITSREQLQRALATDPSGESRPPQE